MRSDKARLWQRVFSCLLVVLLVFGSVPASALAQATEEMREPGISGSVGEEAPSADASGTSDDESLLEQGTDGADANGPAGEGVAQEEPVGEVAQELATPSDGKDVLLSTQSASVSNPRVEANSGMESGQLATWDCVWFGSYPQAEVTSADATYPSLQSASVSWDTNGDATVGGVRYRRISRADAIDSEQWPDDASQYRYFRHEPIKWRVLEVSGNTAFVVADKALDYQLYNTILTGVTWKTCSLRSWLNGYGSANNQPRRDYSTRNFFDAAFRGTAQRAVLTTNVVNSENSMLYYNMDCGEDTQDRVFLLSASEMSGDAGVARGFRRIDNSEDEARRCGCTDYAHAMGVWVSSGGANNSNCTWRPRSPAGANFSACVTASGVVTVFFDDESSTLNRAAVRPALNLDLSSSCVSAAGTVSSAGDVNEVPAPEDITKVTVSASSLTYDGKAKRPAVKVWAGDQSVPASGYDVTYKNNVNVGTATVTVKGKGSYTGTKSATFKIAPASLAKAAVAKVANQAYTGKAVTPRPKVTLGGRTLKLGTDYTLAYKNNTKAGTATVTVKGKGNYTATKSATFKIVAPSVRYRTHVQSIGDQAWKKDGQPSGTFGKAKRLEGIWIELPTKPVSGSIQYRTHVQSFGDQAWRGEGKMSGTHGLAKRLESIQIRLTGNMAKAYDVWYRVHAQTFGWMGWAKNGARSGTAGYAKRLEAIQILVLPKGSKAPASNYGGYRQATAAPFRRK